MANYDDLKEKAKSVFSSLADVSAEAVRVSNEKARALARKAKLNAGIANERATIRRLNVEIGAKYYSLNKDNPDEALRQQCEDVTAAYDRIKAKQAELDELNAPSAPPCDDECCTDAACSDPNCSDPGCECHSEEDAAACTVKDAADDAEDTASDAVHNEKDTQY